MKALTVWSPWSSLIIEGAKPFEFRGWDYRTRYPSLVGQRIVIHAGARKIVPFEVQELLFQLCAGNDTGLVREPARQLLMSITGPLHLPLAAGLGTAVIGEPLSVADPAFREQMAAATGQAIADSDRLDHSKWAWPMSESEPWEPVRPARGMQGFWEWRE